MRVMFLNLVPTVASFQLVSLLSAFFSTNQHPSLELLSFHLQFFAGPIEGSFVSWKFWMVKDKNSVIINNVFLLLKLYAHYSKNYKKVNTVCVMSIVMLK